MKQQLRKLGVAASLSLAIAAPGVQAAYLDSAVPANAYIVMGGLDWAWAYPLPAGSGLDLSFQSSQGWRLPSLAELLGAPLATDFMFAGANVPLNGVDPVSGAEFQASNANLSGPAACATPYFSNDYKHCDWQDGNGQLYVWAGLQGAPSWADQLVVRNHAPIPEPASLGLLGVALAGLAFARRKSV